MANAYSNIRGRQGWIDPTNQEFSLKALMMKEAKYTQNEDRVLAIIEKHKALQLARGVDQDYLNKRLGAVIDGLNSEGMIDFGNGIAARYAESQFGQVVDNNVMTAIQQTQKILKYQNEVDTIKEKKPELYNQLNEAYGLSPAQEYMNNKEVGAKINGNLTYTPYQDIEGELGKLMLDIQKSAKDGVIQTQAIDPNTGQVIPGQMRVVTVNGKSAAEIREIAMGMMGDKYNPQLRVNAWGSTGGFSNLEGIKENATQHYEDIIDTYDKSIDEYKTKLTGNISENDKEVLKNTIKQLENQKLNYEAQRDAFDKDPVSGLVAMERDKVVNRLGKAIGLLQTTSVEYKKDDYYFANEALKNEREKMKLDREQFNLNQMIAADNKTFKEQELKLKALEIANKAAGKDDKNSSDETGSSGTSDGTNVVVEARDLPKTEQEAKTYIEDGYKEMNTQIKTLGQETLSMGKGISKEILNIANGTTQSTPQQQRDAKILISAVEKQFKRKFDVNNNTDTQLLAAVYARRDSTDSLTMLNLTGVKGPDGTMSGSMDYKTAFTKKLAEYNLKRNAMNGAINKARKAELDAKTGKNFTENEGFKDFIRNNREKLNSYKHASVGILKDSDVSRLTGLIGSSNDVGSEMPKVEKGSRMKIVQLDKDTFGISYSHSAKVKGEKDVTNYTPEIKVKKANLDAYFPEISKAVNTNIDDKSIYTYENVGKKPLVGTKPNFRDTNNQVYYYLSESPSSPVKNINDRVFLSKNSTEKAFIDNLPLSSLKPDDRTKFISMIEQLLSPSVMNKVNPSTYFDAGVDGSGRPMVYNSIVDNEGNIIMSSRVQEHTSLDEMAALNESAPQVTYSKMVLRELANVLNNYSSTQKLTLTPALEKLLK